MNQGEPVHEFLEGVTDKEPDNPEPWDFKKHPAADIVVINIGTNDQNAANNVSTATYIDALTKIIQGVHGKWPNAEVIVMVSIAPNLSLNAGLRSLTANSPSG